jgi:hypothetical protein
MPLSQVARIARLKAQAEKNRAAQQATAARAARDRDHTDPTPARLPRGASQAESGAAAQGAGGPAAVGMRGGPAGLEEETGVVQEDAESDQQPRNAAHWAGSRESARPVPQADRGHSDAPPERGGVNSRSIANPKAEAAAERLKQKLDQKAAQRTAEEQAEVDQARAALHQPQDQDDEVPPEIGADPAAAESRDGVVGRDPDTGNFLKGHTKVGGRTAGTPNRFPRNSFKAMKELIAGRILKSLKDEEGQDVSKTAAEVMADAIFDGMLGRLILSQTDKGITIANPLHAVKLFHDYMLKAKELALKAAEIKKKETGAGGGIRVVLPSVPVDPLLRPGQKPRPLRLLGQDPSKPIEYYQDQDQRQGTESCTGAANHEPHGAPALNARSDVARRSRPSPRGANAHEPPAPTPPEDREDLLVMLTLSSQSGTTHDFPVPALHRI